MKENLTKKSLACLAVGLLFLLVSLLSTGTIDYRSSFQLFQSQYNAPCRTGSPPPLRVYIYDLPRRFNVGMMEKHRRNGDVTDSTPVTSATLPPWPRSSGLMKQHSVEYWMMASLLYDGDVDGEDVREVVRVSDPDSADVYFVPFFSSMSFNTHGKNMTDPDTQFDRRLQAEVLERLRGSYHWQRSSGRDHVIPMHHPNAFRFLRDQVNASVLIVSDFGRYDPKLSNLRKDVVAPYMHMVDSFLDDNPPDPYESRTTLLFFRGRTVRKDEGKIRARLEKILNGTKDVIYEGSYASNETIHASTQGMRSSKFCLHPAGDTPSSCRLFDAIVSHCVPVIVSDHIELPYEDEIDYNEFSVFISVEDAEKSGNIVSQLRAIPKMKWIEMWKRLKSISHHFEYQYPPKKEDAVDMIWRQVRHKLPAAKLAVHRSRRLKLPDWWR